MGQKKVILPVEADTKKANAEIKKTKKELSGAKNEAKGLTDSIDQMTGGMISGFRNSVKGLRGLISGLKTVRGVLIATGLGLFVVLLGSAVEYFRNFEGAVRTVNVVLNTITGTLNSLVANFNLLLKGKFGEFFRNVADDAKQAAQSTNDLFDAQQKLFELNQKTIGENAELNAIIKEQTRNVRDSTLSVEERIKAQEAINEASEKLLQNEKALIEAELERIEAQKGIVDNYEEERELLLEEERIKARLITITSDLTIAKDRAAKQVRAIEEQQLKEEQQREKERQEAIKKRLEAERKAAEEAEKLEQEYNAQLRKLRAEQIQDEVERRRELTQIELDGIREKYGEGTELEKELLAKSEAEIEQFQAEQREKRRQREIEQEQLQLENDLMRLEENSDRFFAKQEEIARREAEMKLMNDELTAAERERIELELNKKLNDIADARIDIIEKEAEAKKQAQLQTIDAANAAVQGIAAAAGENKGIAIAAATIDTFVAANKALAQGGIAGPLLAAGIIGQGIANVRTIASTDVPGGGATSSATPPIPSSFDEVTNQRFDAFQQEGQATRVQDTTEREPVQAFVLEGAVTSSQNNQQRLRNKAKI